MRLTDAEVTSRVRWVADFMDHKEDGYVALHPLYDDEYARRKGEGWQRSQCAKQFVLERIRCARIYGY